MADIPVLQIRRGEGGDWSVAATWPNGCFEEIGGFKNDSDANFTAGLAQLLAPKGIRANAVAPGPIWTSLIPSTMPEDAVVNFGKQVPMKRPGQPAELASAYVMLADPISSYVSGATIAVTGGRPIL